MDNRISSQIKKVTFGNSFAFKIESNILKSDILKGVLNSLLPIESIETQFPSEPIDGFINIAFEWILRYTYVQHNYIMFCYKVHERFDCKDIPIATVIGRKYIVMINKYTQELYLVNFRFSNEMFEGTLFDGILLKDNCIYPDYFESTYLVPEKSDFNDVYNKLQPEMKFKYNLNTEKYEILRNKKTKYTFDENPEIFFRDDPEWNMYYILHFPLDVINIISTYYEPYRNIQEDETQTQTQTTQKEKTIETHIPTIWNNYKEITQTIDFSDVFKQKRLPAQYIFHIQAVYQITGEKISHSTKKLVDSISYSTLLNVQTKLFQNNNQWTKDESIDPFIIRNSIDTMYYTRHTQNDLRNPFHNDYLRYHPQALPNNQYNVDECEYKHFIPEMTQHGEPWKLHYKLGTDLVVCTLHKTKYPYVYSLTSKDKRVEEHELAKVYTLECRRYIRVILNKIHTDKAKPLLIKCRPVIRIQDNNIIGWIPVKYDIH